MASSDAAGPDGLSAAAIGPDDAEPGYLGSAADAMDSWGEIDLAVGAAAVEHLASPETGDPSPNDSVGSVSSGDELG